MTLDEVKKLVHDFGVSPAASRICSNKNDMKRTRIGSKEYVSHQIYLLEKKTDGSFYFKTKHPDLKMSQRTFEIKVITKLPNSEQSYKGKVKTHNYINRQNQSTTGKL
jgi:hypothetical protein